MKLKKKKRKSPVYMCENFEDVLYLLNHNTDVLEARIKKINKKCNILTIVVGICVFTLNNYINRV